ncbi:MAG: hypothetical protein ACLFR2_04025 [Candidatus Kapaibacterium sp.]
MKLKFAAIKRDTKFSPNHVETDDRIIQSTAAALREKGAEVNIYEECDLNNGGIKEEFIFNMTRSKAALSYLSSKISSGAFVINSPEAILNCYRENMTRMLPDSGIPFPKNKIIKTGEHQNGSLNGFTNGRIWVKRGDVHALHREDVAAVFGPDERDQLLMEFNKRGIEKAVLQQHLEGDVVKFYAVRGTDFFHWYYFDRKEGIHFSEKKLHEIAIASAEVLGVDIYGGDAVISPDGSIRVIDLNDWPSFAPVRKHAASVIADFIFTKAQSFLKQN